MAALGLNDQKVGRGINGKRKEHVLGVMLGCGKAIGVNGGLLAGPSWLHERVVQKARPLLYSTAQSPFVSGAVRASLAIVFGDEGDALRARLVSNVLPCERGSRQPDVPFVGTLILPSPVSSSETKPPRSLFPFARGSAVLGADSE